MNLIQIARSWFAFAQGGDYTKLMMQKRLTICDSCPHKTQLNQVGELLITLINEEASTYYCSACGCPLATKTAGAANECPLKKWGPAGDHQSYF